MSTTPQTPSPIPPGTPSAAATTPAAPAGFWGWLRGIFVPYARPGEIVIISHSILFYWWPVWLTGFILAGLTYFKDTHVAFVPADTTVVEVKSAKFAPGFGKGIKDEDFQAIVSRSGKPFEKTRLVAGERQYFTPTVHPSHGPGIVFAIVLLITILITSIHMRGLWSVVVILFVGTVSVLLALLDLWGPIVEKFQLLNIHINLAGYLFISTVLFIFWLVTLVFFDRQLYVIVTAGQVRVRLEIGGGETVYDSTGMVFRKRRSDFFRHLFVGWGSGDLVLRPAQSSVPPIELPNVLRVSKRVKQIEVLLRERKVMPAPV